MNTLVSIAIGFSIGLLIGWIFPDLSAGKRIALTILFVVPIITSFLYLVNRGSSL